jgi:hypothetical protein
VKLLAVDCFFVSLYPVLSILYMQTLVQHVKLTLAALSESQPVELEYGRPGRLMHECMCDEFYV